MVQVNTSTHQVPAKIATIDVQPVPHTVTANFAKVITTSMEVWASASPASRVALAMESPRTAILPVLDILFWEPSLDLLGFCSSSSFAASAARNKRRRNSRGSSTKIHHKTT